MESQHNSSRLVELMQIFGLKQQDIIKKTGISSSCLSSYINGKRKPKSDKIRLIANAYNVNPMWLMGFDNEQMTINNYEMADLDAKIINDLELKSVIKKYYSLPKEKQEVIRNLIMNM